MRTASPNLWRCVARRLAAAVDEVEHTVERIFDEISLSAIRVSLSNRRYPLPAATLRSL
jgi:hypothetical protein